MKHTPEPDDTGFPGAGALAALRAWYAGLEARQAVMRYLGHEKADGQSSRAMLTGIRSQLQAYAARRRRQDLVSLLDHSAEERLARAKLVIQAIEELRHLPIPVPVLSDPISTWLPGRPAAALAAAGLKTLADLVPRMLHRRRWWAAVPGLGITSARELEQLLQSHPGLLARGQELVARTQQVGGVVPWDRLMIPVELDGTQGAFRALSGCTLSARNDYEAVNAWLSLQEKDTTIRSYRKEAERLVLWATLERGKPISGLTAEDAIAYRGFLRKPTPRARWVGPARPRKSHEWRPFQDGLSPRSTKYALSVIGAMFRWLKEQNYVLANPFANLKVKGSNAKDVDVSRALTRAEWDLVRIEADLVDLRHGWDAAAAQRLRFMLDFWLATGLRPGEMAGATLVNVERVEGGDNWLHVRGKSDSPERVAIPPLAIAALERYLAQRGLPVSSHLWAPGTPLLPNLEDDGAGLTTARVWAILKRFFLLAAEQLRDVNPVLSEKLARVSPHWLRHTHASQALAAGVSLKSVRDNLRHKSISTTTIYLDADDVQRAGEMRSAFS